MNRMTFWYQYEKVWGIETLGNGYRHRQKIGYEDEGKKLLAWTCITTCVVCDSMSDKSIHTSGGYSKK